jgi:polysaccharide export outer membrane protein
MIKKEVIKLALFITVILFFTSCASSRKQPISYLDLSADTSGISKLNIVDRVIQKGDLVNIIVYSDNPVATALYNQPLLNPNGSSEIPILNPVSGYLVDNSGNIQFQSLGLVYVEGLTKQQLSDSLSARLKIYLTNPYCTIRLLNYKITIMGEVLKPNAYNIPNERINILEAIGLAGDVTLYGRRDNVKVIREINGTRQIARLDLRRQDIFKSDYFYLQQNDVVIVDQLKNKQQASDQVTTRNIGIIATLVSTLAIVFSAIRR